MNPQDTESKYKMSRAGTREQEIARASARQLVGLTRPPQSHSSAPKSLERIKHCGDITLLTGRKSIAISLQGVCKYGGRRATKVEEM